MIERFCEAEARDYLCYRIGQMPGAIGRLVPDTALNAIIHHGGGIPGRLDLILMQSLVATRGVHRQLSPDTVNAVAQAIAKVGSSVVLRTVSEGTSGQVVEPLPSRTFISDAPERRHPVLYPGALVCVAVLLVGGIGTAAWHSSVLSNTREINGSTPTVPTLLREPRVRTAIPLIAGVTTDASTSVAAPQHEGAAMAGSLPTGSAMGADTSPTQAGIASPPFGSSPSPASPVQWARPQGSPEVPAASPQVPVSASSAATSSSAAQPSGASALATAPSAPVPPASIAAAAPSMLSPAGSAAPAAAPKELVSTPTTIVTDGAAQPLKTSPSSAEMLSITVSRPSPQAAEQSMPSRYVHAASASGPQGSVLPAPTEATVPDSQRRVLPNSVKAPPTARNARSDIEATAPAAPVSGVLAIPAPPKTSARAPAAIPALAAPPSPRPQSVPADSETAQIPASLPPEIVADLLRRGDAMLTIGDISAARLLYGRAADSGDGRAATQLGKTYDPAFLSKIGAWSVPTDAITAAKWYRKAMALGDAEATERLKRLGEAGQ